MGILRLGSVQITDLTLEDDQRTLSRQNTSMSARWRDIAEMGSASDAGDTTPTKRPHGGASAASARLPLPQRPFGLALEHLPAAYCRAGLDAWAEIAPSIAGMQVQPGAFLDVLCILVHVALSLRTQRRWGLTLLLAAARITRCDLVQIGGGRRLLLDVLFAVVAGAAG